VNGHAIKLPWLVKAGLAYAPGAISGVNQRVSKGAIQVIYLPSRPKNLEKQVLIWYHICTEVIAPMNIKEDIRPISYIKANAAEILAQVNETRRPVYVTQNGEAKAVLLDAKSYEKMKKTIGLLKLLAQGERDIVEGKVLAQQDFFKAMDRGLDDAGL